MSYDLTVKTAPARVLSPDEIDRVLHEFRDETNLDGPCEVIRHKASADDLDVYTLKQCFSAGEFSRAEFTAFCSAHNIADVENSETLPEAAFFFLVAKWGQDLFTLELPRHENEVREAYRLIVDFAKARNLVLHDPQVGRDIELHDPADLPPMWK